jgi:hypothetical protein
MNYRQQVKLVIKIQFLCDSVTRFYDGIAGLLRLASEEVCFLEAHANAPLACVRGPDEISAHAPLINTKLYNAFLVIIACLQRSQKTVKLLF